MSLLTSSRIRIITRLYHALDHFVDESMREAYVTTPAFSIVSQEAIPHIDELLAHYCRQSTLGVWAHEQTGAYAASLIAEVRPGRYQSFEALCRDAGVRHQTFIGQHRARTLAQDALQKYGGWTREAVNHLAKLCDRDPSRLDVNHMDLVGITRWLACGQMDGYLNWLLNQVPPALMGHTDWHLWHTRRCCDLREKNERGGLAELAAKYVREGRTQARDRALYESGKISETHIVYVADGDLKFRFLEEFWTRLDTAWTGV